MNVRTRVLIFIAATLAIVALIVRQPGILGFAVSNLPDNLPEANATPVLVELFTSEGCSSCPPADALLLQLGRKQPVRGADVIVLEEHVDYWDSLGWKDPFSSAAVSERQNEYGKAFGGEQIYTPQMIVDGHAEFVGSSEGKALWAIRTARATPKPAVNLAWGNDGMLAIRVEPLVNATRGDSPQAFIAVTENMLHSDVRRGENAGRALEHDGVTRQLLAIGKVEAGFSSTVAVHPLREWKPENLRAVVFVQELHSRRILAASAIHFPVA